MNRTALISLGVISVLVLFTFGPLVAIPVVIMGLVIIKQGNV